MAQKEDIEEEEESEGEVEEEVIDIKIFDHTLKNMRITRLNLLKAWDNINSIGGITSAKESQTLLE